jgi:hypothetical protein
MGSWSLIAILPFEFTLPAFIQQYEEGVKFSLDS